MQRVEIDLNTRTSNGTYVGFEDLDPSTLEVGDEVLVYQGDIEGYATVEGINYHAALVYLNLDWRTLQLMDQRL